MVTRGERRIGLASGCGMALVSVSFGCILLVFNGTFVAALYTALGSAGIPVPRDRVASQFLFFVGPLMLLVFQWWLIDLLSGWARRRRSRISQ